MPEDAGWDEGELQCRAHPKSFLCLAFCEKQWLSEVDIKCSALLMLCMETGSSLLVERNDKLFKHIPNSFIHSCFIVLSCCSVIFLRFKDIRINVSEHSNNIFFSGLLLSFWCGLLFCTGQPAARYVPCTSCQDTLYPDSKSCSYPGNCCCHPRGG